MEQGADVSDPILALLGLFFPNATRIEKVSSLFFELSREVGQILFLKREGLFHAFPNLGRQVIKLAKDEIYFLICPS